MMNRLSLLLLAVPTFAVFVACSSTTTQTPVEMPLDSGVDPDAGVVDAPTGGTMCTTARNQLLLPVDKTSTRAVTVVSDSGGTKLLYVDASAGGIGPTAATNPRIYVDLEAGTRVDLTDKTAPAAATWDLALKRDVIFTNSGDAGVGMGGAASVPKAFASVTTADLTAANIQPEKFFDADCNPNLDPTGAALTTFSDWYDYDMTTNIPTPKPNVTYIVRGGTGKTYKVGIKSYDGLADGGTSAATGFYLLEVSSL